jgi:hypothetical protein
LVLIVLIDRFPGPEGNREGMSARANEIVAIFKPITHCLTKLDPLPPSVKAARDYSEVRATVAKKATYDSHNTLTIHPIAPGNNLVHLFRRYPFD